MSDARKVLGQANPVATTLVLLYKVPPAVGTTVLSLVVANRGSGSAKFRISVAINGAPDDYKQYIFYDTSVSASGTFVDNANLTLSAGDEVRCYASTGNLSFNLFGVV